MEQVKFKGGLLKDLLLLQEAPLFLLLKPSPDWVRPPHPPQKQPPLSEAPRFKHQWPLQTPSE